MNKTENENRMGTMQEGKLVLSMGAPMMLSMFVSAFYNVLDTFFVARIPGAGDAAATALTLSFPVEMFMVALNVGTGVGVGSALSRALGRRDRDEVSLISGNAMFLYGIYYLLMLLFGLFGAEHFIALFTKDETVRSLGTTYLRLMTAFSFVNMGEKCFEKLLQATGRTGYSMVGQITASVIDAVLDPIMIYGWFGLPAMGVTGAAVSTLIGQGCAVAITATLHFKKNTEVENRIRSLKPDGHTIGTIMKVGVPAIVMQGLTSVTTLGMNLILKEVSEAAITAYGVYYKLQSFIFMPAYGINNACIPIIGYNIGARNMRRVKNTIKYSVMIVLTIMFAGVVVFQMFAEPIVGVFALSEKFTMLCVTAIHIITWGFAFAGLNVLFQGICQAMGGGIQPLMISVLRLVVFVLPPAFWIAQYEGAEKRIWCVFPVAETLTFVFAVIVVYRLYHRTVKQIYENKKQA